MSENNLIMPKQTGQSDAFFASLKLYYDSYMRGEKWFPNQNFKIKIQEELPYLSAGAQNGPYLVKQSELTRYFGLVYYDYQNRQARITEEGIDFYNAYIDENVDSQIDILMKAIFNNSFGRNNTAIKTSDSDIDPPKLFLKAIFDLNGITRKGLAYLIYLTHDLKIKYNDAILELSKTDDEEREIPIEKSNKYSDVKFTVFLNQMGIVDTVDDTYIINSSIYNTYKEQLSTLSIYNKKPELTLILNESVVDDMYEDEQNDSSFQEKILVSYVYDITGEKFKAQNNRVPVSYQKGNVTRYKTNSRIAKTAIDIADYKCLIDTNHETFISKTGKQYMEAHHLIPMAYQKDFSINIDRIENIVSICPNCHSAIHLGNDEIRFELLKKLYNLKIKELNSVEIYISFDELYSKYYK